ncbi:hypothetical protein [Fischerella sp.]|jgi:hypothetical protein|nr:hypothetical protein [Fischerella sp.]
MTTSNHPLFSSLAIAPGTVTGIEQEVSQICIAQDCGKKQDINK